MSYVLVMLALWPDPMLASRSYVMLDEVRWRRFTLEQCEMRKITEQRKTRHLMIYGHCRPDVLSEVTGSKP